MNKALLRFLMVLPLLVILAGAQEPAPPVVAKPAPRARVVVRAQGPEAPEPSHVFQLMGSGSYLGVDTRDVTSDRVGPLKLKEERGVEIVMVDKDAPAGKAGLKEHDVILSFNGEKVESVEQLRRMIRETPSGRTVDLGISRDGQPMSIKAQLADRRKMYTVREGEFPRIAIPKMDITIPEIDIPSFTMLQYSRRNGIVVENLTPQLREFFGVKSDEGVLVRSVEKGSRGEGAGLKAGDVIVRVGSERVSDAGDWNRLLRRSKGGSVAVTVVRERKEHTLSLTLPERKSDDSSGLRFSIPEVQIEIDKLRNQLDRIQPEVLASVEVAQAQLQSELSKHRQDMGRAQREFERTRPQLERALREAQEKYQREMERLQRELRKELEEQD